MSVATEREREREKSDNIESRGRKAAAHPKDRHLALAKRHRVSKVRVRRVRDAQLGHRVPAPRDRLAMDRQVGSGDGSDAVDVLGSVRPHADDVVGVGEDAGGVHGARRPEHGDVGRLLEVAGGQARGGESGVEAEAAADEERDVVGRPVVEEVGSRGDGLSRPVDGVRGQVGAEVERVGEEGRVGDAVRVAP